MYVVVMLTSRSTSLTSSLLLVFLSFIIKIIHTVFHSYVRKDPCLTDEETEAKRYAQGLVADKSSTEFELGLQD